MKVQKGIGSVELQLKTYAGVLKYGEDLSHTWKTVNWYWDRSDVSLDSLGDDARISYGGEKRGTVSYTHLTLPTILLV